MWNIIQVPLNSLFNFLHYLYTPLAFQYLKGASKMIYRISNLWERLYPPLVASMEVFFPVWKISPLEMWANFNLLEISILTVRAKEKVRNPLCKIGFSYSSLSVQKGSKSFIVERFNSIRKAVREKMEG